MTNCNQWNTKQNTKSGIQDLYSNFKTYFSNNVNFEQVWEVQVWKIDPSNSKQILGIINSSSRVTLLCNLPMPEHEKDTSASVNVYYVMGFRSSQVTCIVHLYLYYTLLVPHTYAFYIKALMYILLIYEIQYTQNSKK